MWNISVFADEIYEADAGFEPALALLQRLGVEYTDLRVVNGRDQLINVSGRELDELQRLLRKYNVKVAGLGTPLFKCPLRGTANPSWAAHHRANVGVGRALDYQYYLDLLPRAFALADRFGTENIRCFSFWREYELDEVFDEVVEKLGRAAQIAEASGHRLFLENEHNTMARTGIELARLLRAVNSPSLTGMYDDGNSGRVGGTPYPDDCDALRGLLGHVHFKFQKLDVMCGWMSLARRNLPPTSGYRPYFPWHQPDLPIKGEIRIGKKVFQINGPRLIATATHSLADYYGAFLTALKRDGYKGVIAIDSSFEGLDRHLGRADIAELEEDVRRSVEDLRNLIAEVWAREPAPGPTFG